jgi:hypothetical protein
LPLWFHINFAEGYRTLNHSEAPQWWRRLWRTIKKVTFSSPRPSPLQKWRIRFAVRAGDLTLHLFGYECPPEARRYRNQLDFGKTIKSARTSRAALESKHARTLRAGLGGTNDGINLTFGEEGTAGRVDERTTSSGQKAFEVLESGRPQTPEWRFRANGEEPLRGFRKGQLATLRSTSNVSASWRADFSTFCGGIDVIDVNTPEFRSANANAKAGICAVIYRYLLPELTSRPLCTVSSMRIKNE